MLTKPIFPECPNCASLRDLCLNLGHEKVALLEEIDKLSKQLKSASKQIDDWRDAFEKERQRTHIPVNSPDIIGLQRYTPDYDDTLGPDMIFGAMEPNPNGEYVLLSDVVKMIQRSI